MTNEWAHCPLLALQWTFAMHIIMIIGGYFPSQGLWMSSPAEAYQDRVDMYKAMSDDSTRRKGGPVEAASDGSEFPLSAADVWAFEEVRAQKRPAACRCLQYGSFAGMRTAGISCVDRRVLLTMRDVWGPGTAVSRHSVDRSRHVLD